MLPFRNGTNKLITHIQTLQERSSRLAQQLVRLVPFPTVRLVQVRSPQGSQGSLHLRLVSEFLRNTQVLLLVTQGGLVVAQLALALSDPSVGYGRTEPVSNRLG